MPRPFDTNFIVGRCTASAHVAASRNPYAHKSILGRFDVNAGVGYGLTPGSDRLMAKDDHRNGSD